jgi:two-component system, chemotaxis family, sensor kinase CheA
MNEDLISGFIEEVNDLLLQLENDLMSLEKDGGNIEIINGIFRVMHTLKGSAGMVGFKNIQDLTHEFEEVYVQIRNGQLKVSPEIITLTLQAKDAIQAILKNEQDDAAIHTLIVNIRDKLIHIDLAEKDMTSGLLPDAHPSGHVYAIIFSPDPAVFERGLDPDRALDEIGSAGETYVIPHEKKQSWLRQKTEKKCQTVWEIYLNSTLMLSDVMDIFLFYEAEEVDVFEMKAFQQEADSKLIQKINKLYKNKVSPALHIKDCLLHVAKANNKIPAQSVKQPDRVNNEPSTHGSSKSEGDAIVNVSSHKLDELMNLVSELVTSTASIEVHASKYKDTNLNNAIEYIQKLTKKFRNNALDLRLVPVETLFRKFNRLVRDLSRELEKEIDLIVEGHEIEIDKSILKSIETPLQHIIRNSIDHGLEKKEVRLQKGKAPNGLLKIAAFYSGANVMIQVQDDGSGINLDRVKECAVKKGYIQADQVVTKQELINLIIEPGFSTAENISVVSGRGVGMDVVRKELNKVGGGLEIFTENDLGTTITLKLPTTLSIIDTLMVDVGDTQILIPVMDVEYCFVDKRDKLLLKDNDYIQYKNNPIPLISLRDKFHYPHSEDEELMVVVIDKMDHKYALIADRIIGEYQAVIKPLGDLFANQPFFSGGSIMVDGKLAFILDTNFIYNYAIKN